MCICVCMISSVKYHIFVQAKNGTSFVVREVNQYMMKGSSNLLSYSLYSDFSSSCIGRSQAKNMHLSLNMKPSWLTWIGTQQNIALVNNLTNDAIKYTCIWPLAWRNKDKPYNSLTPLQWFLTFLFTSQREKEAMKDERTHHGAIYKS